MANFELIKNGKPVLATDMEKIALVALGELTQEITDQCGEAQLNDYASGKYIKVIVEAGDLEDE